MRKHAGIWKKSLIGLAVIAVLLTGLLFFLDHQWKQFAKAYQIEYTSYNFDFPAQLKVRQLQLQAEGVGIKMEELEVEWAWKPLFNGEIKIESLTVGNGEISYREESGKDIKLKVNEEEIPQQKGEKDAETYAIDLNNVNFNQIRINTQSNEDSLSIAIAHLKLNKLLYDDSIWADSLSIDKGQLLYTFLSDTISDNASSVSFEALPDFRSNVIELNDSKLEYRQADQSHTLTELDLKLKSWKNTNLMDFSLEKLTFTYKDTLDLELVVEDGKIADNLDTYIQDINLKLPGVMLNISEVLLNNQTGLKGRVALGESSISVGALKRFTPIILVAMDSKIPNDSLLRFKGRLSFDEDHLSIDSLPFQMMEETRSEISGMVDWSGDSVVFDFKFDDIHTSRSDLYAFLVEEDYNEFFLWPSDIKGSGTLSGNLNYFDIRAKLASQQGLLDVKSLVTFDQDDNIFYSIGLHSDSVLISQIVDYLPVDVSSGSLQMDIAGTLNNIEALDTFRMDLKSSRFIVEERLLEGLYLSYYFNNKYDSVWLILEDDRLLADFQGAFYSNDTSQVAFEGNIQHLSSDLLSAALPPQLIQTQYSGKYDWYGDDYYQIALETDSVVFASDAYDPLYLPSSQLIYQVEEDSMSVALYAGDGPVFRLSSSNELMNVSTDSAGWLTKLPHTEAYLSIKIDSTTLLPLTGYHADLNIQDFKFKKEKERWNVHFDAPKLRYEDIILDSLYLALEANDTTQNGVLDISAINNPYINLDSLLIDIAYFENAYQLDAKTNLSDLKENVSFGLQLLSEGGKYLLRVDDQQPLVIAGKSWQVNENQGLSFNSDFALRSGALSLQNQSTKLSFATQEDGNLGFNIDALNLGDLINTIDTGLMVQGNMDAELSYQPETSMMKWEANVSGISIAGLAVGNLSSAGQSKGDSLNASVKLDYQDTHAFANFESKGEATHYNAVLDKLDIGFLESLNVWPENMKLSGILTAEVSGTIDPTFSSEGFLAMQQSELSLTDISTSMRIKSDTMYFNNDQLELRDFSIYDDQDNPLTLMGTVRFQPEVFTDIQLVSENFQLLHEQNRSAFVKGNLGMKSELSLTGSPENLTVFGLLKVLPGAYVNYIYQGDINVIDASETVSFVEFDQLDENTEAIRQKKVSNPFNWNVNLDIENSTLEVLLNEVTQEYVRLSGGGQIRLRGGNSNTPMVYGSLSTSSGRALIFPPVIPDLDLNIQETSIVWNGEIDNPEISFRGAESVKASPKGISSSLKDRNELVDFEVLLILDKTDLNNLSPRFDVQSRDGQVNSLLQSMGIEQREKYAIDLLIFGTIGSESVAGASQTLAPFVSKLNEIANRNLKNTDVSFGVVNYENGAEGDNASTQTNINYNVSRGLFKNRMFFTIGGDVGVFNDTPAGVNNMPSAHLLGNIEIGYRISEKPAISLKGARKHVYEGVIDGDVVRSSIGLNFRKSYRTLGDIFGNKIDEVLRNE